MPRCPGSDPRLLKVEVHKCSQCGYEVEFFSDEVMGRCPKCKSEVHREKTPSCIDWCKSARECLGEKRWQELKGRMEETQVKEDFKDKILAEMKVYFAADKKRIAHAEKVTEYAEQILRKEAGDRQVVIPAAILHDIGIKECEKKYGSTNGQLQEKEGPPIARKIMEKLDLRPEIINEACQIIASHHSPGELETLNFKIIWDSDWLVNLRDEYEVENKDKLGKVINKVFQTPTGKELATKIYL